MTNIEILENLKLYMPEERIKQNEPMKLHTSFKVGGPADFFVTVESIEELKNIIKFTKKSKIPLYIVGNGTNLLVKDNGISGIVVKLAMNKFEVSERENSKIEVKAQAGVPLAFLGQKMLQSEIAGLEELSGIPGTIGGAIIMNAGAHGKEMKDIVKNVVAIDYDCNICEFTNEQCKFEYRNSMFENGKYIILQANLELEKGNKDEISRKMSEYMQFRKEKQPLEYPSAGSTFKRGTDFVTAKLIDDAGLKGYSIGGAQVSEKHAGFIINKNNATAQDILNLIKYVQETILKKFNKNIELEVKII